MFSTHQPLISAYARASAEGLARVGWFVVASIRNPLYRAARDSAAIVRGDTTPAKCPDSFFGFKLRAAEELWERRDDIYRDVTALSVTTRGERERALAFTRYFAGLHGFGVAKAGFYAQLVFGVSGCLDTHNLERFGIEPRRFRIDSAGAATCEARVRDYVATVERFGDTAALWDTWCDYVATRDRVRYRGGDHVSALHCHALGIEASYETRAADAVPF